MGSRRSHRSRTSTIESLESRRLMSATPSLDLSFGDHGVAAPGIIEPGPAVPPAIAIESDGKILIASNPDPYAIGIGGTLVRLNADGSLDTSFWAMSTMPAGITSKSILVQSDGKIVVAGLTSPLGGSSEIVRMNADGSLDTTFGTAGSITLPMDVQTVIEAAAGCRLLASWCIRSAASR